MHVQHAGNLTKSTNKLWSEKRKLNFDGVQIQRGKVISESESWVDQVLFFPWRSLDIHFSYAIVFCCCAYRNTWRKTTPIGWMKIENEWIPSRGAMNCKKLFLALYCRPLKISLQTISSSVTSTLNKIRNFVVRVWTLRNTPGRGGFIVGYHGSKSIFFIFLGVRILLKKLFYLLSYSRIEMKEGDLTSAYRPIQVWKPVIKKLGYCIVAILL